MFHYPNNASKLLSVLSNPLSWTKFRGFRTSGLSSQLWINVFTCWCFSFGFRIYFCLPLRWGTKENKAERCFKSAPSQLSYIYYRYAYPGLYRILKMEFPPLNLLFIAKCFCSFLSSHPWPLSNRKHWHQACVLMRYLLPEILILNAGVMIS